MLANQILKYLKTGLRYIKKVEFLTNDVCGNMLY